MNLLTKLMRRLCRGQRPLPFRPFHPARLVEGPAHHLIGQEESLQVRAVMEVLERAIMHEAIDVTGKEGERLAKASGRLGALMDLHESLENSVKDGRREGRV